MHGRADSKRLCGSPSAIGGIVVHSVQSSVVLPVGQIVSGGPLCSACEDTSPAPPPMVILGQRTGADQRADWEFRR